MEHPNLDILNNFDESSMPNLDVAVLGALERFSEEKLPKFPAIDVKRPLIVGSGNAAAAGRILFRDTDAVYADESNYQQKLDATPSIDGAIIISASGGKDAPRIAEDLKNRGLPLWLLTNNLHAPAREFVDSSRMTVFPKNREPYTYNTSTYLGMILSQTREDPSVTLLALEQKNIIETALLADLSGFNAFTLIVPQKFSELRDMFRTKFDELFGPMIVGRVFTTEEVAHAKTVVSSEKEFFIDFGEKKSDIISGWNVQVPFPAWVGYGAALAIGYYVIGKIQEAHPPYFKENISRYVKEASEAFKEEIKPIVE